MKKETIFTYIIIIFVLFISYKFYTESSYFQLKCVISDINGKKYCLREREKIDEASDLLAEVEERCKKLVKFMEEKYPNKEEVKRLVEGFSDTIIQETLPTSTLTAYSENKGDKIALCLLKEKEKTKLIDMDTLTFVAIHELAHIMTKSVGHKKDFWDNFKFLLENAKESNIYNPQDFKKSPQQYCGMKIDDNPYYDM